MYNTLWNDYISRIFVIIRYHSRCHIRIIIAELYIINRFWVWFSLLIANRFIIQECLNRELVISEVLRTTLVIIYFKVIITCTIVGSKSRTDFNISFSCTFVYSETTTAKRLISRGKFRPLESKELIIRIVTFYLEGNLISCIGLNLEIVYVRQIVKAKCGRCSFKLIGTVEIIVGFLLLIRRYNFDVKTACPAGFKN